MSAAAASAGLQRFRHIAIEGPIGVGKSTLARRLAQHLGAALLPELPQDNPFLDRFYEDMPGYAFQTQLAFLFQRVKQIQAAAQPGMFGDTVVVSDFMFAKDAIFARLNLGDEEFRLYSQMYAQVASQVREPDLIVWLQASPATLLRRVHQRAIPMEQGIAIDYLERLSAAYAEFFRGYDGAPVFAVDTERFDPLASGATFDSLVQRLGAFSERRGEYGPSVAGPIA